jgi:hypothetical protein
MSTDNQSRIGSKYRCLPVGAKRAIIASRKRQGDGNQIAFWTGYSEQHVSNVLHGRYENKRILNFAYNMVRGRQKNTAGRA